MRNDDETSRIAALARRDAAAWSAAVDRHLGEVYGVAFHLCGGDRAVAEEVTQQTWLAAIDGIARCDPARGTFRNWLLGIARTRVALYFRRAAARKDACPLGDCTEPMADFEGAAILPEDVLAEVQRVGRFVPPCWSCPRIAGRRWC